MSELDEIRKALLSKGPDYSPDEIEKGYTIVQSDYSDTTFGGALTVQVIDDINLLTKRYDGDFMACRQAEKDGIQFINDIKGLEKGCYVDTPENRIYCIEALINHPVYQIENWIFDSGWADYLKQYENRFGKV